MHTYSNLSRPAVTWARVIDQADPENESMRSIQPTGDGGYIIAGSKWHGEEFADFLLIKTDISGYKQWEKTFSYR